MTKPSLIERIGINLDQEKRDKETKQRGRKTMAEADAKKPRTAKEIAEMNIKQQKSCNADFWKSRYSFYLGIG